jgi:DNA (cytosine-5)-methyltransferase 1
MGANSYQLSGGYNKGYKAMGDAVAVPVVNALAKHLLVPLARKIYAE